MMKIILSNYSAGSTSRDVFMHLCIKIPGMVYANKVIWGVVDGRGQTIYEKRLPIHTKPIYYQNPATVYEENCGAVCKTIV